MERMNMQNRIGEWLDRWCLRLGAANAISQREFAEFITEGLINAGVYHSTVNNWARGKSEPKVSFLLALYARWFHTGDVRQAIAATGLEVVMPEVFGAVIELEIPAEYKMRIERNPGKDRDA